MDSFTEKQCFRLTSAGRALWARRGELQLPLDYRRILGLVDYDGHAEVVRSYLARYPGRVVDRLLTEFQARGLIEAAADSKVELSTIARPGAPPLEPEDAQAIERNVSLADISLSRLGVYVAHERIAHRPASSKRPHETVALVVEDDPDQLAQAVGRLRVARYAVRTADGVRSLFRSLQESVPDAIFLDVGLPDGDGYEVLARLRRHPSYALLPIILLTARGGSEDVARGLALGADGYVTKPYGKNSLDYLLRYVMKQEI